MKILTPASQYALLLLMFLSTCAPPPDGAEAEAVTITRDSITLTVEPARGGRISSLTYGGQEVLNVGSDTSGFTTGSVAWTSPQENWGWPPPASLDRAPFTVQEVEEYSVLLIGDPDPETGLVMQKRYRLGPDSDVGLTYWLTNKGDSTLGVAPWEVTRLPYGGTLEFYADSVRSQPAGDHYTTTDSLRRTVTFDGRHAGKIKLFAALDSIPAVYRRDGLVLEKHTVVTDFYRVAPGQAPLEVYLDPERNFVEFELQGDYRNISYGETVTLRTRWKVGRE